MQIVLKIIYNQTNWNMITKSLTKNTIIPVFQTQTKTNRETQLYIKDKTKISFLVEFN